MLEEEGRPYHIIPKKVIIRSILYQLILLIPLLSFFCLLMLGILQEPGHPGESKNILQRLTILFMWVALFSSAAFFSCVGSLVSYSARGAINERDIEDGSLVLSMHIVGSVFGIILLLLFIGKFIAGNLFPNFSDVGFFRVYQGFSSIHEWAKLFIWTFIAGFSERLMPDLLGNVAKRIQSSEGTQ